MKSEEVYKEYFEDEEYDLSESPYETYSYQAGWNFGLKRASIIIADEIRPKGKWIVGEYMDCHSDILPMYTCPFCGEKAYRKYDFCHYVGFAPFLMESLECAN